MASSRSRAQREVSASGVGGSGCPRVERRQAGRRQEAQTEDSQVLPLCGGRISTPIKSNSEYQ